MRPPTMTPDRPANPRTRPLDSARDALARSAAVARLGLIVAGGVAVFVQVRPMVSDAQFTWGERRVAAIVAAVTLGGFALAAWALGRALRAVSSLIGAIADGFLAIERLEARIVPELARSTAALERLAGTAPDDPATAAVRRAIREGHWGRAERLLRDFARDRPHSAEATALAAELAAARRAEADDLDARLESALAADDAAEALVCRDALTRHLGGESLRDLDARLARWLSGWVRKQVRRGAITPEVADIAARGADRFGDTAEGRSLLTAVPDLRRRAGLCPSCARPYRGLGDACPSCSTDPSPRRQTGGATPRGLP